MSSSSPQAASVSCLVISCTPSLLNRLLQSLRDARSFWQPGDEVLCSWNGSEEEEREIDPDLGPCPADQPALRIAQRHAYHFATNMNALADQASGDLLVLLNDDLVLDPGSLDRAIQVLRTQADIGLVGGRLRSSTGLLTHAGLLLANNHIPYNRYRPDDLGPLVDPDDLAVQESGPMQAVTGALMVLWRRDFLELRFHEDYRVCGEDIALCLDFWTQLGKHPYYASDVTAIHDEKTTRGNTLDHYDIRRLGAYAARVVPGHAGLEATGRYWASQESEFMWKVVQQLRKDREQAILLSQHLEHAKNQELQHLEHAKIQEHRLLERRIAELEEQGAKAETTISAMKASSSWQLTAPLRLVGNKIKSTRPTQADATAERPLLIHPMISESPVTTELPENHRPNLIFDALILGQANRSALSRGGIYRYASQLLVALGRERALERLLPYCPDPLLSGSVNRELQVLEEQYQVSLGSDSLAGKRPSPSLPAAPAAVKRLVKPFYRRLMESPVVRAQAHQRLEASMLECGMTNTVFHTPFQSVPQEVRSTGLKAVVVTVHDMLPRIHPEFFTSESIRQFDALLEQLLPSDHVICVSESTKRDFLRCHPSTPAEQVHVTPLAAPPELRPVDDEAAISALRRELGLQPGDQVVLSLCTLEPRKNLTTLIVAFEQLWQRCDGSALKLVLAGSLGWKTTALTDQLRASPAAEAIVVSGHIPEDQLGCLYSLADAFVYPSVYEGFGLPPLEAMQCGTPVIVGKISSLPEVVGDAAVLVDPRSPAELEAALADLLGSAERRRQLRQAGLAQAAGFCWSSTAQRTAAIYRSILRSHG